MVNREQFEEICNRYGLDSKKLIKNNENVLEKADYNSICYVLDFLRDTLKVTPNNIEKCPSILYLKIEAIKENWKFLNEKKINTRDVETCLHILSTEPEQLKKTYEYVSAENRYGKKYIEQITTILRVSVERIQEIEEKCPELTRENILSAAISRKGVDEIKEIVRVCQKNEVKVTDGVFRRSATEIREIIRICQENGIEIIGSVFRRTATEVEEIVEETSVFAASVAAAVVSAVLLPHPAMDSAIVPARIIDKSFPVFFIITLPVLSSRFCNCSVPSQLRFLYILLQIFCRVNVIWL